jgi:uncharacterized membrane protein
MSKRKVGAYRRILYALLASSAVSVLLYGLRVFEAHSFRHGFLFWNLFLAWLPLIFAWWLVVRLRSTAWLAPQNVLLTLLCLGFLPNSFYMVSDLIHLEVTGEVSLLYDAALYTSFIFNGFVIGYVSVYLVHRELIKRLGRVPAHGLVTAVFLACSFAIYLGRYLRWNTWDVLINPAGLLFDVSDRIISPGTYPQAFVTTGTFFLLIGSTYLVGWQFAQTLRSVRD